MPVYALTYGKLPIVVGMQIYGLFVLPFVLWPAHTHKHAHIRMDNVCAYFLSAAHCMCDCVCVSGGVWGSRLLHVNPFQLPNATQQERSLKESRTNMGPN